MCDRFIFPLLEMRRNRRFLQSADEIAHYIEDELHSIPVHSFSREFEKLKLHFDDIIDNHGNYVT